MTSLENPLISVIMPVYNGSKYIGEALESIVAQDYRPLEIIVVDDGSTDNSAQIAESFSPKVQYFYQENQGPAAARNTGLAHARGSFIAFCDADDLWPKNKLALQLAILESNPKTDIVLGKTQKIFMPNTDHKTISETDNVIGYRVNIGSGLYRRNAFGQVGNFNSSLLYSEDYDWLLRAREQQLSIQTIDAITLLYRMHDTNMTDWEQAGNYDIPLVLLNSIRRRRAQSTTLKDIKNEK